MLVSFNILALDYGAEKSYEEPRRQVSLIISKEGYYPEKLTAFVGERVRFFVTNSTRKQSCMILREKDLFISTELGKISEGEVLFDKPGTFKFYCPTGNISGSISVLERPSTVRKREIASEKKSKKIRYWLPKDE